MWVVDGMIGYEINIKETVELSEKDLYELIELKQQYWAYDEVIQKKWFDNNIKSHDHHILVRSNDSLLAYLNIVNIIVELNDRKIGMLGIGNVCVDKEHVKTGMGSVIIGIANSFIKKRKMCGILLCRNNVTGFYKKNQWDLIVSEKVIVNSEKFCHSIMTYDPFELYFTKAMNEIYIDRFF